MTGREYSVHLVSHLISEAIRDVLTSEQGLLYPEVGEETIAHKLGVHLISRFPEYHVDLEYRRNLGERKTAVVPPRGSPDGPFRRSPVRPDIIIHLRGTNENVVVIEVKKTTSARRELIHDTLKLESFTDPNGSLRYLFGVLVEFDCRNGTGRVAGTAFAGRYTAEPQASAPSNST